MSTAPIAKRLRVHGRVQGVGFRHFVLMTATALALDGFVRNRKDGTVEALCVGDEATVNKLIEACRKGPPASQVEHVDIEDAQGIVEQGFRQLPTV